jgi:hypothetical protein
MNADEEFHVVDKKAGAVTSPLVYDLGGRTSLTPEDLLTNEVAIVQLMNDRNEVAKQLERAKTNLADKESEIEYLRTSPFVSILAAIFSSIGATVLAIGVNCVTASPPMRWGTPLTLMGAAAVIVSSCANIFYPYARRFFNKRYQATKK